MSKAKRTQQVVFIYTCVCYYYNSNKEELVKLRGRGKDTGGLEGEVMEWK